MSPKERSNGKAWEGYIRVSSIGRREVLISPEIQRDAITAKAAQLGVEVGRWTEDLDRSGHTPLGVRTSWRSSSV